MRNSKKLFPYNSNKGYVVFTASRMIIIKDIINKTYQFINHEGRFANVTAMVSAQRPEGGLIIAVGESSLGDDRESCTVSATRISHVLSIFSFQHSPVVLQPTIDLCHLPLSNLSLPSYSQNISGIAFTLETQASLLFFSIIQKNCLELPT